MRHRKANRRLRRTSEQRLALLRNLASSLIEHGALDREDAPVRLVRRVGPFEHIESLGKVA